MGISILLIASIFTFGVSLLIQFKSFKKEQERSDAITEKKIEELQARKKFYENMTLEVVDEDD